MSDSDRETLFFFSLGFVLGVLLSAAFWSTWVDWADAEWKREAVESGHAEWSVDESGQVWWAWK